MSTGRDLERLVAAIETQLLPKGLHVEVNEHVVGDDGTNLAEFDIVISGPIGSTSVRWLVECRDRPASGPAPAQWIEQLVGRRQRFAFEKVFAVSTTGFAVGAQKYAEKAGILTRTVTNIDELATDFRIRSYTLRNLTVDVQPGMVGKAIGRGPRGEEQTLRDVEVRLPGHKEFVSLNLFIADRLRSRGVGAVADSGQEVYDHKGPIQLRGKGAKFWVSEFHAPFTWRVELIAATGVAAQLYAETGRPIGAVATVTWSTRKGPVTAKLTISRAADGKQRIHCEVRLEDLPKGMRMDELGIEEFADDAG